MASTSWYFGCYYFYWFKILLKKQVNLSLFANSEYNKYHSETVLISRLLIHNTAFKIDEQRQCVMSGCFWKVTDKKQFSLFRDTILMNQAVSPGRVTDVRISQVTSTYDKACRARCSYSAKEVYGSTYNQLIGFYEILQNGQEVLYLFGFLTAWLTHCCLQPYFFIAIHVKNSI